MTILGPSWSWSYGSWIYSYQCNRCLSLLTLWVQIPLRWVVLNTTLCCDKVCQWLAEGVWFSMGTPVSSINKTDCHNITEILLKVVFNTLTLIEVNQTNCFITKIFTTFLLVFTKFYSNMELVLFLYKQKLFLVSFFLNFQALSLLLWL